MFDNKNITKGKIKDILYAVRNEFENEIDSYETESGRELTDDDFNIMFEFLDRFINKTEMVIDDEVIDNTTIINNMVEYLIELWGINEKDEIKNKFKNILGFTDEDIINYVGDDENV